MTAEAETAGAAAASAHTEPKRRLRLSRLHALTIFLALLAVGLGIWDFRLHAADRPEWSALGRLPDWGGLWIPDRSEPKHPWGKGDPVWTPDAAKQIAALNAADKAGHPVNIYINCLPEGMPSFVIMTLNATEFLFTPGRVTILGEFDGNRLRRIYTDGRKHPSDPDLTFNGHSIGHWEGGTLVVDTVGVLPETFLPVGQSAALPNNGDLHIVEHIGLVDPSTLRFQLEISAPHVLAAPWKVTRLFKRQPDRKAEIVEASCRQGDFLEKQDEHGNAVFVPIPHEEGGAPLPF
jgi:hypothetical protein